MQTPVGRRHRIGLWRRLWLALAEVGARAGPRHPGGGDRRRCARTSTTPTSTAAAAYERRFRHDVMAHVHAFGDQAPAARPCIHLGATSAFVTDNADLHRHARRPAAGAAAALRRAARGAASASRATHAALPCLAYTHFQPAQLDHRRQARHALDAGLRARHRGARAPARDAALPRLQGHHRHAGVVPRALRRRPRQGARAGPARRRRDGLRARRSPVTGQTYPRKVGQRRCSTSLAGIAQSAAKMATDLRLLQHEGELHEPFETRADRFQRDGLQAQPDACRADLRAGALRRCRCRANGAHTAAHQWLERTLDDSRQPAPRAARGVPRGRRDPDARREHRAAASRCARRSSARHVDEQMPFMATERWLMLGVQAGGDRQALHEVDPAAQPGGCRARSPAAAERPAGPARGRRRRSRGAGRRAARGARPVALHRSRRGSRSASFSRSTSQPLLARARARGGRRAAPRSAYDHRALLESTLPLPLLRRGKVREVYEVDADAPAAGGQRPRQRLRRRDARGGAAQGRGADADPAFWFAQLGDGVPNHCLTRRRGRDRRRACPRSRRIADQLAGPRHAGAAHRAVAVRVRGARLPQRLGLEGVPGARHAGRRAAARRACVEIVAASSRRSSPRPPRPSRPRREHHVRPRRRGARLRRRRRAAARRSLRALRSAARDYAASAGSSSPTPSSSSASTRRRHAAADRRGADAGLVPLLAGRPATRRAARSRASTSSRCATGSPALRRGRRGTARRRRRRCPTDVVAATSARYLEAYRRLTGHDLLEAPADARRPRRLAVHRQSRSSASRVLMRVRSALDCAGALWLPMAIWVMAFFRDPPRDGARGDDLVIAPADGKVVSIIRDRGAGRSSAARRTRISIFMNVFNVHVNRYPMTARSRTGTTCQGKFLNAADEKARARERAERRGPRHGARPHAGAPDRRAGRPAHHHGPRRGHAVAQGSAWA